MPDENQKHVPVLLDEVIAALNLREGGIYLDGTVGYGGHAEAILAAGKNLKYIGLDRDQIALDHTKKRLAKYGKSIALYNASYLNANEVLKEEGIEAVDGILLDLGASSPQFDDASRGFSFKEDGPLDMRFDISGTTSEEGKTAADIVNTYQKDELRRIMKDYGEERYAGKIAHAIVERRKLKPFSMTSELKELVEQAIPRKYWPKQIHPATKTFQALRIETNQELEQLKQALPKLVSMLRPGGRIAIISFHSLEDRIVKQAFRYATKNCICPKEFPVCRCDKNQTLKLITKKPITAAKTEIKQNVRSRSAKLRIAEHL